MTILIVAYVLAYGFVAGVTFRVVANSTQYPNDPWMTPGPFFAGVTWPLFLPLFLGSYLTQRFSGKGGRKEAHRTAEIEEAEHKLKLAKIAAEELKVKETSVLG